jgi:hypothetical protein
MTSGSFTPAGALNVSAAAGAVDSATSRQSLVAANIGHFIGVPFGRIKKITGPSPKGACCDRGCKGSEGYTGTIVDCLMLLHPVL